MLCRARMACSKSLIMHLEACRGWHTAEQEAATRMRGKGIIRSGGGSHAGTG